MPKRNRSQDRLDKLVSISRSAKEGGWTTERVEEEIENWLNNYDLSNPRSIATARSEARRVTDPRIRPHIERCLKLAKHRIAIEPPGSTKRANHELMDVVRTALKHPVGIGAALTEMEKALRGIRPP